MARNPTPSDQEPAQSKPGRTAKAAKPKSRVRKAQPGSQEHAATATATDGRSKRVWKACERCRMKKTKCDGESPCKRCKDDGLVCTAGVRKKLDFKQLPQGYAEVLENTQYALISTVQKLYTMLRNGETWDLGEPELNERGLPVIHDIASKLGCIRPSPDVPYSFAEDDDDFAELQAQLHTAEQATQPDQEDSRSKQPSPNHPSSPRKRRARARSSDSEVSFPSSEITSTTWSQPDPESRQASLPRPVSKHNHSRSKSSMSLAIAGVSNAMPPRLTSQSTVSSESSLTSPSFPGSNSQAPSTAPSTATTPYSPWSASANSEEFLTNAHALEVAGQYLRAQQGQAHSGTCTTTQTEISVGCVPAESHLVKTMQMDDQTLDLDFMDDTSRLGMFNDPSSGLTPGKFDLGDPMDTVLFEDAFGYGLTMS